MGMAVSTPEGWTQDEQGLHRSYTFDDFTGALAFVVEAGRLAEEANHHPDIDIRWNKVQLTLITHSAGHVTDQDAAMAERLNQLPEQAVSQRRAALFD